MDFVIGAISLASLVLNYVIYRRVSASYSVGTIEELEVTPVNCCCSKLASESVQEPIKDEINTEPVQADYGPWKNQKNIPWISPSVPQAPIKTVEKGPLARPDGFV